MNLMQAMHTLLYNRNRVDFSQFTPSFHPPAFILGDPWRPFIDLDHLVVTQVWSLEIVHITNSSVGFVMPNRCLK